MLFQACLPIFGVQCVRILDLDLEGVTLKFAKSDHSMLRWSQSKSAGERCCSWSTSNSLRLNIVIVLV
jgi:hypothetical protein